MSPEQIVIFGIATMPMVAGIVQVFKTAGFPSRFAGVLALVLGLATGGLAGYATDTNIGVALAQGLMAGLGASGAWTVTTSALNGMLSKQQPTGKKKGRRRR